MNAALDRSPFVDAEWLAEHHDDVVIADARWGFDLDAAAEFHAGHIPGAIFVDVDRDLADPPSRELGRHPLPTPDHFAATMRRLGIDGTRTVVAYDTSGGVMAARLVWLLRALGLPAAVLDGGLAAWPGALEEGETAPPTVSASFAPRPWPEALLVPMDAVPTFTGPVLDARPAERFRGEGDEIDARAGHIPGAQNLPTRSHLDAQTGRLKPRPQLRAAFAAVGVSDDSPFLSYCGSGVTACHQLLVAEEAGLHGGRLYPGSWSQWAGHAALPVETGEAAGPRA